MSLRSLLETFDTDRTSPTSEYPAASPDATDALGTARSEGYEAGYASGWEDAQASEAAARVRVAAEFERNIESLAFTYHEAVDLVRAELFGFIDAVIESFLPPLLPCLTREYVRDSLREFGDEALGSPIEIVVSSDSHDLLAGMLSNDFAMELTLIEDATLAPNQVFLRLAAKEVSIDLKPLLDALKAQFDAIKTDKEKVEHVRG